MSSDDDIPVLSNVVARKSAQLTPEQIDEICDSLNAAAWVLIDKTLSEALRDAEETLRVQINDRLSDEFPELVARTLREKLNVRSDD